MAAQKETGLQQRIQDCVERRGGYIKKNHGSMIAEPGIADLTVCYKGLYFVIEAKVGDNKPSRQQGIHCRSVQKSGGITMVAWDIETVEHVLDLIDLASEQFICHIESIRIAAEKNGVDNGTKY